MFVGRVATIVLLSVVAPSNEIDVGLLVALAVMLSILPIVQLPAIDIRAINTSPKAVRFSRFKDCIMDARLGQEIGVSSTYSHRLHVVERPISAFVLEEMFMPTRLDDSTFLHDHNAVGAANSR